MGMRSRGEGLADRARGDIRGDPRGDMELWGRAARGAGGITRPRGSRGESDRMGSSLAAFTWVVVLCSRNQVIASLPCGAAANPCLC